MTATWDGRLLVVGAGLIGTSLGLAASAAGAEVLLTDRDRRRVDVAASLGAGRAAGPGQTAGAHLVVVAAPPSAVGRLAIEALRRESDATVSHVCSIQSLPQHEV